MALLPWLVSEDDILFFTKHLSVLVENGIPISEALSVLETENKRRPLFTVIQTIEKEVLNGSTLEKGLSHYPNLFNSFYQNIVSIGEESGTLDKNLHYLAEEIDKNLEFKRKIQGILLYPAIVLTLAILVGGGVSIFVLPQLADLFSSLTIELPLTTQILISLSLYMRQHGIVTMAALLATIAAVIVVVTNKMTRRIADPVLVRLPVAGPVIVNIEIANMCRNIGIMLQSGLPITRAFEIARDTTDNSVFKQYIDRLYQSVSAGQTLESELSTGHYPMIPASLPRMLGVGEHSGTLDQSFLYMSEYYAEEVSDLTKRLPQVLEPILLVTIAGIVLFVALAIITPIYKFTGSIHP